MRKFASFFTFTSPFILSFCRKENQNFLFESRNSMGIDVGGTKMFTSGHSHQLELQLDKIKSGGAVRQVILRDQIQTKSNYSGVL